MTPAAPSEAASTGVDAGTPEAPDAPGVSRAPGAPGVSRVSGAATPTVSARRNADEQRRLDHALVELFEHRIVFNRTLGLAIDSVRDGDVRAHFAMRPELIGHATYGRLHGGVTSAVLDAMGGLALMVAITERFAHEGTAQVMHRFVKMGTIDLRVDYLRQGLGTRFDASAEVTKLGARIGNAQMRLVNDQGVLIATAAGAYAVA